MEAGNSCKMKNVTALEAYDLTTKGGGTDFAKLIQTCESFGPYCLIGGLAVNCYVEPVYTLDADIVAATSNLAGLSVQLEADGYRIEPPPHSLNASLPESQLRIQFTADARYQEFLKRAVEAEVLGARSRSRASKTSFAGSCGPTPIRSAASVSGKKTSWI